MKLVVKLDYYTHAVFPADQAGVLVPALSTAVLYSTNGYGKDEKFVPKDGADSLKFEFVSDDKFEEAPEAFSALQKDRDDKENKYLNEWSDHRATKKELEEIKAKLATFDSAVKEALA